MKTVIIGTDFVYDSTGALKPVEINTNIGISLNKIEEDDAVIFDDTDIKSFINSNNFTKITYIGANYKVKTFLSKVAQDLNLVFNDVYVGRTSLTVPEIENTPDHLIIRTAYDVTAILDEEYCKNKVNFLNLIKNTEFGSQFAYVDVNGQLVNNITTIKDNGPHPNFILKAVHPDYDRTVYPKLFRATTQEELNVILQNVNSEYFLMEFHLNLDKVWQDQVTKIRKMSLLYPPTLQSIHIGAYTDLSIQKIQSNLVYDPVTLELDVQQRYGYITKDFGNIDRPKLMDDDFVVLADGTLKSGLDLQVGDIVKTINIPNSSAKEITEDETVDYNIDYNTFISGVTYNTNKVTNKRRIDAYVKMCSILFTDGTTWSDTINSRYLVLNEGIVKFKTLHNLVAGDIVLLINTQDLENIVIEQKTIVSIQEGAEKFSGWVITVEETHLFLTKTDGSTENSVSFAAIEHNLCYVECGKGQCMAPSGFAMYYCIQ